MAEVRYPDIDRGWAWLVMVMNFSGIVLYCSTMFMSGVVYITLLETYGEGKAKTSLVGALSGGLLCFFGPVVSVCINKLGCRVTIILGGAIVTASNVISAFVQSLDALIISAGVMTGIGYALCAGGLVVSLGYYFQKWRNTALSMAFVMTGAGLFVSSPLGLYALEEYGLSGSFLIAGCLNAQLCIIGMICRPSTLERQIHRRRKLKPNGESVAMLNLSLLKNRSFVFFLLTTATWNFALLVAVMHLPNYLSVNGATNGDISLLMTVLSVANTAGRFLGAMTVGTGGLDSSVLYVGTLGLCGVMTCLFPLYSGYTVGQFLFAIQLGLYVGCPNALMTPICIQMLGIAALAEANGFCYFFCGIGVTAGPVVAGYVFGATGSYNYSFLVAGVVLLFGSASGMASFVSRKHASSGELASSGEIEKFFPPPVDSAGTVCRCEEMGQSSTSLRNCTIVIAEPNPCVYSDKDNGIQVTDQTKELTKMLNG